MSWIFTADHPISSQKNEQNHETSSKGQGSEMFDMYLWVVVKYIWCYSAKSADPPTPPHPPPVPTNPIINGQCVKLRVCCRVLRTTMTGVVPMCVNHVLQGAIHAWTLHHVSLLSTGYSEALFSPSPSPSLHAPLFSSGSPSDMQMSR